MQWVFVYQRFVTSDTISKTRWRMNQIFIQLLCMSWDCFIFTSSANRDWPFEVNWLQRSLANLCHLYIIDKLFEKRTNVSFRSSTMHRLLTIVVLLICLTQANTWSIKRRKLTLNTNDTCCVLVKLNINATRANYGRTFFESLILNNDSYKDVNEDNICSLMHFFMQEAVLNGRPIKFSKGWKC